MMAGHNNRGKVLDNRILYTPSLFARTSLLHLQEAGCLTALLPHTSQREKLQSCLCFVVLEGKGRLSYGNKVYPLTKGDVVFIDCQKSYAHSTGNEKQPARGKDTEEKERIPVKEGQSESERLEEAAENQNLWTLQWCHFYGPSLAAIYAKYQERGGQPVIRPKDSSPYTGLLTEIYAIASSDDYIRDMRINEKLNMLLTHLMSESWHPEVTQAGDGGYGAKRDIQQIKAYVDEHYKEKITLDLVSETFFINKYYLARLFKEQYGMSLNTYLQQVRITHAKHMLRFTDEKIETIGMECGMGELSYFSRIFKKVEGVSPREYRSMW